MIDGILRSNLGMRTTVMAAMSYISVLCFVPLLTSTDDEFVAFHAKQGLVIWMSGVLALFVLHLPVIGQWIFGSVAGLALIFSALGIVSVVLQRAWRLPLVGWLADRL
ncbi:MAG TPA: hypothetical protein HPP80_05980 [Rhodospirillaceae bacterium]|nr:hypothetical protein [Rhodospirillaceae bacterium]